MADKIDDWVTTTAPIKVDDWVTEPPPAPPIDYGQGAADVARVAADSLTLGQWNRARAGLGMLGGKTYSEALAEEAAKSEAARNRLHPFVRGTAQAIGGLPVGYGAGAATNALVGTAARSLPARIGIGATEGAAIGAAEGAGNTYTGDPADYFRNATMGGVFGAAVGSAAAPVAQAASRGMRFLEDRGTFGGPSRELAAAAQADAPGLNWVAQTPGAMLPDAGPSMQGLAAGSVPGAGGPGKSALITALRERNAQAGQRITGDIDTAVGPAPTPSYVEASVRGRMQDLSPAYDAVFARARAIDPTPIGDFLTNQISTTRGPAQAAMRQVREMLQLPDAPPGTLDPHPRSLQAARTAVRGMQESAEDPAVRAQLGRVYDRMTSELQRRVPGIRRLDAQYAELGSQERAIQPASQGARVFQVDRENVARPTELRDTMTEAAQPKGVNVGPSAEAFRLSQAARGELDRIVGTNRNDRAALNRILAQPQDWNSQKLAIVFGQDRADQIRNILQREDRFYDTYHRIVENSETANRLAAAKALEASKGDIPLDTTVLGAIGRGGQAIGRSLRGASAERTRDTVAQMMATRDPAEITRQTRRLLAAEPDRNRRQAITNEILRRILTGGGTALAAQ